MNPSESHQFGWAEGHSAGLQRGLAAGYQKGAEVAVDLAGEIGFYEGFCQHYLAQCDLNPSLRHKSLVGRLLHRCRDLQLDSNDTEKSLQLIEELRSMAKLLKLPGVEPQKSSALSF